MPGRDCTPRRVELRIGVWGGRILFGRTLFGMVLAVLCLAPRTVAGGLPTADGAEALRQLEIERVEIPVDAVVVPRLAGWEATSSPSVRLARSDGGLEVSIDGAAPLLEVPDCRGPGCLDRFLGLGGFTLDATGQSLALAIFLRYSTGSRFASQDLETWWFCALSAKSPNEPASGREGGCVEASVDAVDVEQRLGEAPADRWMHRATESDDPATFSATQPLLADHDSDGWADVLLWRRFFRSKPAVDAAALASEPEAFEATREEVLLLRFEAETGRFTDPERIDGASPAAELWNRDALPWSR